MNIEEEVKELIYYHGEGEYLDFKKEDYSKENKAELIKDVIALANSHSDRNKYIIIGVIEKNNICQEIKGIDKSQLRDEAEFQQILNTYIYENLVVNYCIISIEEKDILVIQIPATNNINRPFMVKKQIGKLKENEIFIRKGSTTVLASKRDLEYMLKENRNSKLILKSYLDGEISDKIILTNVNGKIKEYKEMKFNQLKQLVSEINQLKYNKILNKDKENFWISDEIVEIEKDKEIFIKKELDNLNIKYDDLIFEFKNVKWETGFNANIQYLIKKTLCGDENEIKRYWKLQNLVYYILEYYAIDEYSKRLPEIYSSNFILSNMGNYFDEDVELKLIIDKDLFIKKEAFIVSDDVIMYLGNMYQDLKEDFIDCPRVSNIDGYYSTIEDNSSATSQNLIFMGETIDNKVTYLDELSEKAEDFKDYIECLFEDAIYEEKDKIIIKGKFPKVNPNKSIFLEAKLLFRSKKVKIYYEITSKNNSKIIYGNIKSY